MVGTGRDEPQSADPEDTASHVERTMEQVMHCRKTFHCAISRKRTTPLIYVNIFLCLDVLLIPCFVLVF